MGWKYDLSEDSPVPQPSAFADPSLTPVQRRQIARDLVGRRAQNAARRFGECVRPLLKSECDAPLAVGSCIFLRIAERLFVLTAAHVIDRCTGVPLVPGSNGPVLLGGRVLRSALPPEGRIADRADVAVIVANEGVAEALCDVPAFGVEHVDVDEWRTTAPPTRKHYVLVGFPSTGARVRRWEKQLKCTGFLLTAREALPEVYGALGIGVSTHVVVEYDKSDVNTLRGPTTPPRPNGISGGAILAFGRPFDVTANDASLIAVITERNAGSNALVGSRLSLYLELIRHEYPELASFIPQPNGVRINVNLV
jgi:hypothetical protein